MNRRRTHRGGLFGWRRKTPRRLSDRFKRTADLILASSPYHATRKSRPKKVNEDWVKTKIDPSVSKEELTRITNDVNVIIQANPSAKQLNDTIRLQEAVAKANGTGRDRNLKILYLARYAMANFIYNFA
jgi:hypothetical protein